MKNKLMLSLVLSGAMLLNTMGSLAAEQELVSHRRVSGDTVTVTGNGSDVSIFLLNPDKTVQDLNNAVTTAQFNAAVNYCNEPKVGIFGDYTDTFEIKDRDENANYLLYVKDGDNEYTSVISAANKIYVAVDGNNSTGNGSYAAPYATLAKAKTEANKMKDSGPVEVIFRGGEYTFTSGVNFTSSDSGTEENPITYKAAEGERVVFTGAKKIPSSAFAKVTDSAILNKVDDRAKDNLYVVDLAAQGITKDIASYLAGDTSYVGSRGAQTGVFLNDNRQSIARWPNNGYKLIDKVYDASGNEVSKRVEGSEVAPSLKIRGVDSQRLAKWANAENLYLDGWLGNGWHAEWAKVQSVNTSNGIIKLQNKTQYGVEIEHRVAVINLLEEIDVPGEYYIDNSLKMYYFAPHAITEDDVIEVATLGDRFINMNRVSNVNFEGIEFTKSTKSSDGIYAANSDNLYITNCIFTDIGRDGVSLYKTTDVVVDGCVISNVGKRNVYLLDCGERNTLTSGNIIIKNCHFATMSRDDGNNGRAGVTIDGGVGTLVEHNVFQDMENSAIRYSGNSHTIRFNEIYNTVNNSADAGAIYAGRSFTQYGTSIQNNYFHHIGADLVYCSYGALFLDDQHSGTSFLANIVSMDKYVKSEAIRIGGGRDNIVKGNIIVNSGYALRGENREAPGDTNFGLGSTKYTEYTAANKYPFQSFKDATNGVSDAKNITDADWLDAFRATYPNIMENFSLIMSGTYKRANIVQDNVACNITESGDAFKYDSRFKEDNTTYEKWLGIINREKDTTLKNNYTLDESAFVDYAGGDYRIWSSVKSSHKLDNMVPDQTFDMSQIGTVNGYEIEDRFMEFDQTYPANNAKVGSATTSTVLSWSKARFADEYVYEVSESDSFANTIASGTVEFNEAEVNGLQANKTYYWRVKAVNKSQHIGTTSDWKVASFTTADSLEVISANYADDAKTVEYSIKNTYSQAKPVCMIVALKDADGRLIEVTTVNVTAAAGQTTLGTFDASTVFAGKDGETVELYFWDSLGTMKNISEKYSCAY